MGVTKQSLTGMILQVGHEILIQTYQQKFFEVTWDHAGKLRAFLFREDGEICLKGKGVDIQGEFGKRQS